MKNTKIYLAQRQLLFQRICGGELKGEFLHHQNLVRPGAAATSTSAVIRATAAACVVGRIMVSVIVRGFAVRVRSVVRGFTVRGAVARRWRVVGGSPKCRREARLMGFPQQNQRRILRTGFPGAIRAGCVWFGGSRGGFRRVFPHDKPGRQPSMRRFGVGRLGDRFHHRVRGAPTRTHLDKMENNFFERRGGFLFLWWERPILFSFFENRNEVCFYWGWISSEADDPFSSCKVPNPPVGVWRRWAAR